MDSSGTPTSVIKGKLLNDEEYDITIVVSEDRVEIGAVSFDRHDLLKAIQI